MDRDDIGTAAVSGMGPDGSIYEYCYEHNIGSRKELLEHAAIHDGLLKAHVGSLEETLDGRVAVAAAIRKAAERRRREAMPAGECE